MGPVGDSPYTAALARTSQPPRTPGAPWAGGRRTRRRRRRAGTASPRPGRGRAALFREYRATLSRAPRASARRRDEAGPIDLAGRRQPVASRTRAGTADAAIAGGADAGRSAASRAGAGVRRWLAATLRRVRRTADRVGVD